MIDDLRPYPSYQSDDAPFLGNVPAHWDVRRAKCFLREADERSQTGKETLLSVSHITGVTPRSEKTITMFLAESNVGYKVCESGDVVINTLWAWMAALGVAKHSGIVSPAYGVYRRRDDCPLSPAYMDYLLRTPQYAAEYMRRSTGVRASRMRLYPDKFLSIPLICPPADEQEAIVRFLAHAERRFQAVIRAKRKQLALVGEAREAVTETAIRESGTTPIRLGVAAEQVFRPVDRQPDEIYTPVGLRNRGRGIFHKQQTRGGDLGDSDFFWLTEHDFVLSGQFAWEGAVALAQARDSGCICSHRYHILRGRPGYVSSPFLLAFFRSPLGALLLDQHSRGAAGRNRPLNIRTLLKEKIPIPPPPAQAMVEELVAREAKVAASVQRAVDGILEYRARLIADVVLGQVDVRSAASSLVDDEIPALADDVEETGDADGITTADEVVA